MSKSKKEHRKKVTARNLRIKQDQERYYKIQKEALMKMINEEKKNGLFENLPQIPSLEPSLQQGVIDGPSI